MTVFHWLHVFPEGDIIDHEPSESCICGPMREPLSYDRNTDRRGMAFVHQPLLKQNGPGPAAI